MWISLFNIALQKCMFKCQGHESQWKNEKLFLIKNREIWQLNKTDKSCLTISLYILLSDSYESLSGVCGWDNVLVC